ncbi:MAG: Asp23/Gls24 family envelope stress response protein [Clostridia bacterium]
MDNKMKVYAFVGPSGTGKSHRAHLVAATYNIDYIIDDGILVHNNKVAAGKSAKTEDTKIASVKAAIFLNEDRRKVMVDTIKAMGVKKILLLGTSDGMVQKIAANLELPEICHIAYIQEYATQEEMNLARKMRLEQGKHVIPVPTFAIKEQFSGYFMDPLKIFNRKKEANNIITERTIIRPTFSYLGNYVIADTVIMNIIEYVGRDVKGIFKVTRTRIEKYIDGMNLEIDITVDYGVNMPTIVKELESKIKSKIDLLTGINIFKLDIFIKGINIPKK